MTATVKCDMCDEGIGRDRPGISIDANKHGCRIRERRSGVHVDGEMTRHICRPCFAEIFAFGRGIFDGDKSESQDNAKPAADAEANRDAVPVAEKTESARARLRMAMSRSGMSRDDALLLMGQLGATRISDLTPRNCNRLAKELEQRLRERQATETADPRVRIHELFEALKMPLLELLGYLSARGVNRVSDLTDEAARELVGVLEFRLADEGAKANA